jgi:release factor glutamine methyltransferase
VTETALALARKAGAHLHGHGFENGRLEAELLLASVLGIRRLDLYLQYDRPTTEAELEAFRAVIRRRLRHEPLQYIVGETQFRRLRLRVDARVLIPRPETEILVGEVLAWSVRHGPCATALDVGTGSGAIALSLLAEQGFERAVATDVSLGALQLAGCNAQDCGVAGRVDFRLGSIYEPVGDEERFDAIVANPPYVADHEAAGLAPEVREWEPHEALFAGAAGLDVLNVIIAGAATHLRPRGLLALEVGAGQAADVATRIDDTRCFEKARIVLDLAGHERIVLAELMDKEEGRVA